MVYRLRVVDANQRQDSMYDQMERVGFGTYDMQRRLLLERCSELFPGFDVPYIVFRENFTRIEVVAGITPNVHFGKKALIGVVVDLLERDILKFSRFRSPEVRDAVNVAGNSYDAIFDMLRKRGHTVDRKVLARED